MINLKAINKKSGVITLVNWTMCDNGETYQYLYSDMWIIITDKDMPVENFRSSEKWQLIAVDKKGKIKALIPGCQVKAWVYCNANPNGRSCFTIK